VNLFLKSGGALLAVLIGGAAVAAYKSTIAVQTGNPGLAMEIINTHAQVEERLAANTVPPSLPPASAGGQLSVDAYKNVQVLGHITSGEFTRLMTAMSLWVSPDDGGCAYCHAPQRDAKGNVVKDEDGHPVADANNMQSDELYTKRVARRMLQMTMRINGDWKEHVKDTGVTCYTCHRGKPVPQYVWFDEPEGSTRFQGIRNPKLPKGYEAAAAYTTLPSGALRPFLAEDENVRVQATEATGSDDRSSIKQTEWTYGLMLHISDSLGVNCTFCHNSRSFGDWDASPSTRTAAWFGIRMVRELNQQYLLPLAATLPPERHGSLGDGPKVSCKTCHQGAYKPLLGVSMLADYGVLAKAMPQPDKTPEPTAAEAASDGGVEGGGESDASAPTAPGAPATAGTGPGTGVVGSDAGSPKAPPKGSTSTGQRPVSGAPSASPKHP
jgi:photosynthetic reaction center cytochrome c subunit